MTAFVVVVLVAAAGGMLSADVAARPVPAPTWNPRAAAAYLDQRQSWWQSWPKAARDHGTACVSCHTVLPYALVRPALGVTLRESDVPTPEKKLLADVVTRVHAWSDVKPFYGDWTEKGKEKAIESRGTESVLNALVLAARDHRSGVVTPEAREAFANMFALQDTAGAQRGAWEWLNFGLRPWESSSAVYFGATLAAIAVGLEPQGYAQSANIQPNLVLLRSYLSAHLDQSAWNRLLRHDDPSLFNRAMLLWASAELPSIISTEKRQAITAALLNAQEADGAWQLTSLGYWRYTHGLTFDSTGDGYATGLIAYALERAGTAPNEPHLARALHWLASHQDAVTGSWSATSLNKKRDPQSNVGKFMSDAATAYAVLALSNAETSSRVASRSAGDDVKTRNK